MTYDTMANVAAPATRPGAEPDRVRQRLTGRSVSAMAMMFAAWALPAVPFETTGAFLGGVLVASVLSVAVRPGRLLWVALGVAVGVVLLPGAATWSPGPTQETWWRLVDVAVAGRHLNDSVTGYAPLTAFAVAAGLVSATRAITAARARRLVRSCAASVPAVGVALLCGTRGVVAVAFFAVALCALAATTAPQMRIERFAGRGASVRDLVVPFCMVLAVVALAAVPWTAAAREQTESARDSGRTLLAAARDAAARQTGGGEMLDNEVDQAGVDLTEQASGGNGLGGVGPSELDLSQLDLDGGVAGGVNLDGVDLSGIDAGGLNLDGVDLSGLDPGGLDPGGIDAGGLDPGGIDAGGLNLDSGDVSGTADGSAPNGATASGDNAGGLNLDSGSQPLNGTPPGEMPSSGSGPADGGGSSTGPGDISGTDDDTSMSGAAGPDAPADGDALNNGTEESPADTLAAAEPGTPADTATAGITTADGEPGDEQAAPRPPDERDTSTTLADNANNPDANPAAHDRSTVAALMATGAVLGVMAAAAVALRIRRARRADTAPHDAGGVLAAWAEAERHVAGHVGARQEHETFRERATHVGTHLPNVAEPFEQLAGLADAAVYARADSQREVAAAQTLSSDVIDRLCQTDETSQRRPLLARRP